MSSTRDARKLGEALKLVGMTAAASLARRRPGLLGQISLIDAILKSHDRTASTDDTGDPLDEFEDDGKWRGSIPKALVAAGVIAPDGHKKSDRKHRHAGLVGVWRAAVPDDRLLEHRRRLARDLTVIEAALVSRPAKQLGLFD